MAYIKLGPRESIRESTWLICEAATIFCELGDQLQQQDREELLEALRTQAERLAAALAELLPAQRNSAVSC